MVSYLVIELPKEEKTKVQLKSALAGLSISDYMIKAINEQTSVQPIYCSCGKETEVVNKPFEYVFEFNDERKKIVILNLPQQKCKSCGNEGLSTKVEDYLEKLLLKEINTSMKNHGRLPEMVNFNELITI